MNQDPQVQARKSETLRRYLADPAVKARRSADGKVHFAEKMKDPEFAARRSELGRVYGAPNIAATRSADARAKAGRTMSATKLAHIPADYREEYRRLTRDKSVPSAEATAMILATVERDRAAAARAAETQRMADVEATRQRMMRGGGRRIVTLQVREIAA